MTESALPSKGEAEQPAEHERRCECGEEPPSKFGDAKSASVAAREGEQPAPTCGLVVSSSAPLLAGADVPALAQPVVRPQAAAAAAGTQPAQAGEMDIRCFVEAVVEGRASLAHTVDPSEIPKSSHKIGLLPPPFLPTGTSTSSNAKDTKLAGCVQARARQAQCSSLRAPRSHAHDCWFDQDSC